MTTAHGVSETATLRKIGWRLLPLIALGYGVAYVDRVNISFAALQMNRDLGFSATVYGLGAGLFFLSYAALEVPSNMILAKVGARRWIARIMLTWGVISMGMAFVQTPLQFYVMRFLLGAAEAGFFPGVIYYLTLWVPETHRARAINRFYFAVPLSAVVMGAVAGSLLDLHGLLGLAGWQWLFLAEGTPAVLLSLAFLLWLPDSPAGVKWLTDAEKGWLMARLAADAEGRVGGGDHDIFRVLLSPTVLALTAVNFLMLGSNYAFGLSAPQILTDATQFSAGAVGYITSAAGLIGAAAMLMTSWNSDRTRERYLHLTAPLLAIAAAFAILALSDAAGAVVGGYMLFQVSVFVAAGMFWLAPGAIMHPRAAAVGVAAINAVGQLGSFVIPALWGLARDQTGTYQAGIAALGANYTIAAVIILTLRHRARRAVLAAA
jgi:MFS transporter, ACS family, tartrate transporter